MQQQLVIAVCAALALTANAAPSVRTSDAEKCLAGIPCTLEYAPICGSDGVTYGNKCAFEAAVKCTNPKLTKASDGECEPADAAQKCLEAIPCTFEHMPVCGSDGVTYANKCSLDAHKKCVNNDLKKVRDGECKDPVTECLIGIPCTMEYVPICGNDGFTYGNKCTFNAAKKCANPKLKKHKDGECDPEYCMSKASCTLELEPVCGSDGKTYGNRCMFDAWARCSLNADLKLASEGECLSKEAMECMAKIPCTLEWAPICGSDGVTYGNRCQFDATKKCAKPDLKKKKNGEC